MKIKPTILTLFFLFLCATLVAQEVVCEGSPCTSNDFTIDYFYLGDENGNPYGPGYCEPGSTVDAHLWINFTANSAANRYDLYLHFNLYVDGVFISTIDKCYFDGQPIPTDVTLDTYDFTWECGSEIVLQDLYMSWQTNNQGTCHCAQSHCYSNPTVVVLAPLIANFEFNPSCLTAFTVDFESTTSGGTPPYTFFWEFGDGTTSTEENPTHTYTSTGPYTVTLTVQDAENTGSYGLEILNFDSNIPPEIYPPPDLIIEGCIVSDIPEFIYSESAEEITESEFVSFGGSIVLGSDFVSLTYEDTSSGICPIYITRLFTLVDSCDNQVTSEQNIMISDSVYPTASNPSSINVSCISDIPAPDINVVTDEADNCSIPTVAFVSDVSDGQSCPETITRTYSVTDDCGNSIEVSQLIVINDDVGPTASNPTSIAASCIDNIPVPDINIVLDEADNCSIPVVAFISDMSDNQSCPETITRTYSVTDACGNSINVSQSIIINDDVPPTANNPAAITLQCSDAIPAPDVTLVDNEAGNCSIPAVAFVSDVSDNQSCPETITRTFSVIDDCGNSINVTQSILIIDDILPTASNPASITVECLDDVPVPDITVVTDATDNCSIPIVAFVSDVSDNQNCYETISRTYSVTDTCGNSIEVTQNIIINDNTPPTASNPASLTFQCISDIPDPDIMVVTDEADNCSTPTVFFVSDVSDNQNCPETITRTYRIEDVCGNSSIVTQSILLIDDVAPTASDPDPIILECGNDIPLPDINVVMDESDNCFVPSVTFISDISNGECPEIISRRFEIRDACNNFIYVTQEIIFEDTTAPELLTPFDENLTVDCDNIPEPPVLQFFDTCTSNLTVTFNQTDNNNNNTIDYDIVREWIVEDECGNQNIFTQNIHIIIANCTVATCNSCGPSDDTIPPTASNPPDLNVNCSSSIPGPDINVVLDEADNCVPPVVTFISENISVDCFEKVVRTYRITDECGNYVDVTHTINVIDTIYPTASNPPDINVQCVSDIPVPDVNVISDEADNCSIPTVSFLSDISNNSCDDKITRTYSVTDSCGNSIMVEQQINVNDDTDPTASNPASISLSCIGDMPVPDINVVTDEADNCSIPTVAFVSDVSDGLSCPETITRTYSVTDDCGNSIEVSQLIVINDDVAPTASNPGIISISCIDNVPVPDINIVLDEADNCSIPVVAFVSDVSDNQSCPETITRTYSVTDDCGNSINVSQSIIINDDVPPTASNPAAITLQCSDAIPAPDVTLVDNEADNCSIPIVAFVSDVSDNQSCPETITRTYSVTDACGNSINVTQSILIVDDILPTASNPATITVECLDDVPAPDINVVTDATDNCSAPIVTFVSDVSDNQNCYETIKRTYSVTDTCDNSIEVTQNIIINDNTPPTASNPSSLTFQCINDIPDPDINVVTDEADNCSTPTVSFVFDVSDNLTCPETITRTYRIEDECGNSSIVTQSIFIVDDVAPELVSEFEPEIYITCDEVPEIPNLEFSDSCTSTIDIDFNETLNQIDAFNFDIQRTWVVSDPCNNQNTFTQSIYVNRITESNTQYVDLCIEDDPLDILALVPYSEISNTNTQINEWNSDSIDLLVNGMFDPSNAVLGDYEFINRITNNDCTWTTTLIVSVNDDCVYYPCVESTGDVTISKMVTPNNDGFNDFFEVDYILNEESNEVCDIEIKVQIYNRWGTKSFESNNYQNNWSGISNSTSTNTSGHLPTGTYYYIVELVNGGLKPIQGYIYLGTE